MPTRLFAALVLLTSAIGCGGGTTATAPFAVVPGPQPTAYAGSIQDSISGAGTLRLTLSSAAGVTGGTWTATFNGRSEPTRVISGSVANDVFTATVNPDQSSGGSTGCTSLVSATFAASSLSGTYSVFAVTPSCPAAPTGSFTVTRQ